MIVDCMFFCSLYDVKFVIWYWEGLEVLFEIVSFVILCRFILIVEEIGIFLYCRGFFGFNCFVLIFFVVYYRYRIFFVFFKFLFRY